MLMCIRTMCMCVCMYAYMNTVCARRIDIDIDMHENTLIDCEWLSQLHYTHSMKRWLYTRLYHSLSLTFSHSPSLYLCICVYKLFVCLAKFVKKKINLHHRNAANSISANFFPIQIHLWKTSISQARKNANIFNQI